MLHILSKSVVFLLFFLISVLIAIFSFITYKNNQYVNKIYPNVLINKTSFDGADKDEFYTYFNQKNERLSNIKYTILFEDDVATFSGKMLSLTYDTNKIYAKAYSIGRNGLYKNKFISQFELFFDLKKYSFIFTPSYDLRPVNDYLNYLSDKYDVPAQNALFNIQDGRVSAFRQEVNGVKINEEKVQQELQDTILRMNESIPPKSYTLIVEKNEVPAEITLSNANSLGIVEKIGEGTSDYTGSASERVHNLILGASKFHGVLIPPEDIFSFNKTIGDVSSSTGYKAGYIIKGGKTILGDGGGICQDSTTLFRAALDTGLEIIERKAHAYRVRYYENDKKPGFDATVFAPSVDLKFKNNTPSYILIQTNVDKVNHILTFSFWGKKDGREVYISDAKVWDVASPPEPEYIDDPNLPVGTKKQIDFSAWGAKSIFSYVVKKDGQTLFEKEFYSAFRPWKAVFLVGVGQ